MREQNVVRYWKDPEYRASLSDDERAAFPENPAGIADVTDHALADVRGGTLFVCPSIYLSCLITCGGQCTVGPSCGYGSAKVCSCCPEYCI